MCVYNCTSHVCTGHIVLTGSDETFERKASTILSCNIFVINSDLRMMRNFEFSKRINLTKPFFDEAARILEVDHVPPVTCNTSTLPSTGRTPTITQQVIELAAAVMGVKGFCA